MSQARHRCILLFCRATRTIQLLMKIDSDWLQKAIGGKRSGFDGNTLLMLFRLGLNFLIYS